MPDCGTENLYMTRDSSKNLFFLPTICFQEKIWICVLLAIFVRSFCPLLVARESSREYFSRNQQLSNTIAAVLYICGYFRENVNI